MSTPSIVYAGPTISPEVPFEVRRHLQLIYQKLGNHTQAFALQQAKINSITTGNTTTVVEGGGSGGSITPSTSSILTVNNQSGATSYATVAGDDGALIVLSDSSPIALSLTPQTPPWGCFVANQGAGTATLTPSVSGAVTPTISYAGNPGAASMPLLGGYCAIVAYDGANWWAYTEPIVPVTFGAVANEFLTAYNATTGAFSAAQPSFSNISGTPSTTQVPFQSLTTTGTGAATLSSGVLNVPTPVLPLTGTTGSMGGSAMTVGQTITATASVTSSTTSMVAVCSPNIYPGAGFVWDAYVSAAGTVTARLTCTIAGTPTASTYNVRCIE